MSDKGRGRSSTLVKFILTQHVQTDEHNFKATVQNLTGMNANVCGLSPEISAAAGGQMVYCEGPGQEGTMRLPEEIIDGGLKAENLGKEDFCRWIMELPSVDEQGLRRP
ncbi:VQ motif-containing protein 10-like [Nymphaea colorata]|uniref:VQ motif-containing protein 10-like n=1 Tax=Nymphaea colorata TaxID=210225 RepID=UPI00129E0B2E|nr:VQ motif-containing protein 10-like [Nymphaea colorata]